MLTSSRLYTLVSLRLIVAELSPRMLTSVLLAQSCRRPVLWPFGRGSTAVQAFATGRHPAGSATESGLVWESAHELPSFRNIPMAVPSSGCSAPIHRTTCERSRASKQTMDATGTGGMGRTGRGPTRRLGEPVRGIRTSQPERGQPSEVPDTVEVVVARTIPSRYGWCKQRCTIAP